MTPLAIQVMAESGVDISVQQSKTIAELPLSQFDWVISLCDHANETCPVVPGKKIHKGFDDPPHLAANAQTEKKRLFPYQRVRDEIRRFIETLPQSLK